MRPDYVFETSWEICNKVGGIHTVISTKAKTLSEELKNNYILIGPDVWKGVGDHPEFEENKTLFKSWQDYALQKGLRFRIGHWKIAGKPIVILVDFTPYFADKDKILSRFWEAYQLDSLTGGWDYIEPLLFGFAAAKVIESFHEFYLSLNDKVIAHFHEWMTGSGILYLKKQMPQIATVFTTHATVLGRCVAGNGLPVYSNLHLYQGEEMASRFHVESKYSMEKLSAQLADSFTVVSELTNKECAQFLEKPADIVTPNGFETDFVPKPENYAKVRAVTREKIFTVVEGLVQQKMNRDALLVINSGRYEFKNKGIDVFIDALGKLNQAHPEKDVLAVIAVPAGQNGVNTNMFDRMENLNFDEPVLNEYSTHNIQNAKTDPVILQLKRNSLNNAPTDKVKVVFIPAYLNGNDGVFNIEYFNFLTAFDLSIFPSYYEPWGYTPMESLAFGIPTITTTLAGFGLWEAEAGNTSDYGICTIARTDDNYEDTVNQITHAIQIALSKTPEEIEKTRHDLLKIRKGVLWESFIKYYNEAYELAVAKSKERKATMLPQDPLYKQFISTNVEKQKPVWKKILIKPVSPPSLAPLFEISQNMWWCWTPEVLDLFFMIDKPRFRQLDANPISFLESLSVKEINQLVENKEFVEKLNAVYAKYKTYMAKTVEKPKEQVAYFSMEYGLHDTLKIFSGGLGMLAGDYLKEASDSNKNMVGIGLLYRFGYFKQTMSFSGEQISERIPQRFSHAPIQAVRDDEGQWMKIAIALPGRIMYAKIWRCDVGRIPLYLLDTDIDDNSAEDREVTAQLYGGNWENRLKQEMLLGIGGIRLIQALKLNPTIYHNNEGHSAFSCIERLVNFIRNDKLTFAQAMEVVRASTLFTTHTPVPAGHDCFSEDMLRVYMSHYADDLLISWRNFMALGRFNEDDNFEKFSMSVLAAKLSQEVNGVSAIHGRVSREMFAGLYPGYYASENHIGHVTNGVHFPTWVSKSWKNLYVKYFGEEFLNDQSNTKYWEKIYGVPDAEIWEVRKKQKRQLFDYVYQRISQDLTDRTENPQLIINTIQNFKPEVLTIGFARRFATYKRAHLLFKNLDKLDKIINNPNRPIQFIFAGKAHPSDKAGQDLITEILRISKLPEFVGKIVFVENYDMDLAKHLVRGVDIWLNTPTRPLEASGTSGEKAVMNGVINFSVLDGWWAEGYKPFAGWALKEEETYQNHALQDALDAETIYSILENEIAPTYYKKDDKGISADWIMYIKNTIAQIAPHFTMKRQLDDYYNKFYTKLFHRSELLTKNGFEITKQLVSWKNKMLRVWDDIEIVEVHTPDSTNHPLALGEYFEASITLQIHDLRPEDIGVEIVFGKKGTADTITEPTEVHALSVETVDRNYVRFFCKLPTTIPGVYDYAYRIYPKNPLLAHRQDFNLVMWA